MIRLRSSIERGLGHPVLGPVLLILLVLMLAMIFLHFAEDSHAVSGFGAACLALAVFFGSFILAPLVGSRGGVIVSPRSGRGPPALTGWRRQGVVSAHDPPLSIPLRR